LVLKKKASETSDTYMHFSKLLTNQGKDAISLGPLVYFLLSFLTFLPHLRRILLTPTTTTAYSF